ncbi:MAG TPA: LamG-like jellyroll fold domain-containing protein, partial [Candidatus Nanoarchaeia archaeon]|nr:LamG-like jellyroll fold domain-containing protein [Candidatus Nanoarchaeia archaeon]
SNGGVILETTNIPANSWTHIFITYNGATGTGTLYRNGTQITTTPMQGPAKDTSDNVYIGAAYNLADSGTWYFNGSIDEVRIYNRTLTLEEIQAHYNATAPNYIQNHSLPRTDNDGNYNYTYTPTQPGEYTIKANTTYDSMSAEKTDILTVSSVNHEPTIDSVDAVPSQAPNPEAEKIVTVNFTVTDTNGISDLNHSSAKAIFNKSGITRSGNCSNNTIDSDTVEYNCSVPMQYYDEPGSWTINVTIIDNAQASAYNATTTFSYQELLYIQVDPVVFGFGDFYPGDNDQAASSNPLQIDNMGNVNLTIINITAYNLVNGSYTLGVSNITVNVSNGAGGTALQDSVSVNIPGANVSLDADGIDANESLYFYITIPNILPLYYSSSTEWVITADT